LVAKRGFCAVAVDVFTFCNSVLAASPPGRYRSLAESGGSWERHSEVISTRADDTFQNPPE
jgi:hypothetical protein